MKTEDIISLLDNADALKFEVQDQLLEYVRDKSGLLAVRFSIWTRHVDKQHHPNGDTAFVEKMTAADKIVPFDVAVTWRDILLYYPDSDIVKELLIEENFGRLGT